MSDLSVSASFLESRALQPAAISRLAHVMARAGWEVAYLDLDLTRAQPTAEIKISRADGRWLWARVDELGRCTVEAFHRERALGMARNQKGRRPLVPIVDDIFLGRVKPEGARSMLRYMTAYIADNSANQIELADVRKAWAQVMSEPVHFQALEHKETP